MCPRLMLLLLYNAKGAKRYMLFAGETFTFRNVVITADSCLELKRHMKTFVFLSLSS